MRTEESGGEDGAFELALHETEGSLEGFCDVVRRLHQRAILPAPILDDNNPVPLFCQHATSEPPSSMRTIRVSS